MKEGVERRSIVYSNKSTATYRRDEFIHLLTVLMPPTGAKRLMDALRAQIEGYEREFGGLPEPRVERIEGKGAVALGEVPAGGGKLRAPVPETRQEAALQGMSRSLEHRIEAFVRDAGPTGRSLRSVLT
ncbi:MAG: hypothetical protein ACE5OY_05905, partial [Candidatus Bathyarchaeia archaeon]